MLSQLNLGVNQDVDIPVLAGMYVQKQKDFENYLIFYQLSKSGVEILNLKIIHGARDLPTLFADEFESSND